jgi:uncharacterized membrane protein
MPGKILAAALTAVMISVAAASPAFAANVRTPSADGTVTYGNNLVKIDASHTSDGYVMVKYTGKAAKIKLRIHKDTDYTYDLNVSGNYETFPLTEGSGNYTILLFENVAGTSYSTAFSQSISVALSDERNPFLYPNQFCNFNANTVVIPIADSLTAGLTETIDKVAAVYRHVVDTISYDYDKAATVQSGYLPDINTVYNARKGICFDYAAIMTSMLRAENIPTRLVIGYSGEIYHAWVSVYTDEQGWVENLIYFDGKDWRMMDPTFASTGKGSSSVNDYIVNPANYRAKFTY